MKHDDSCHLLLLQMNFIISVLAVQEQGIAVLSTAIEACTQEIEHHKGKLVVKEAPRVVSVDPLRYIFLFYKYFGFPSVSKFS